MKLTEYTAALLPEKLQALSVLDLLNRLKTADSADRLLLGEALAERMPAAADLAARALADSSWKVRWGAAHALGKSNARESAPALRGLLIDPQPRVARTAAWALGRIRDETAVPFLSTALHSSNSRLSAAAAWALGHIGNGEALEALTEALDSVGPRALRSISVAFAEIGPEASGRLVQLLQSGSVDERNRAARILARFGPNAAYLLLPLLDSPNTKHRRAAAHILGGLRLKRRPNPPVEPPASTTVRPGPDELESEEPDPEEPDGEESDAEIEAVHSGPVQPTAPANDSPATDLMIRIQDGLVRVLSDEDLRVRLNSARSLGTLGFTEARPALEKLLHGGSEEIRVAANALATLDDPAAGPALREALDWVLAQPAEPGRATSPALPAIERALSKLGLEAASPRKVPPGASKEDLPTRNDYLAMVTPGLEMVAWEEIAERLPGASLKSFDDGSVVFQWKGSPQACAILRSVRRVFHGGATPEEIPLARRLRRYRVRTLPASLEPTTAYDMARLCNLGEGDVFVDITCGSGSIAIERALDGPARLILAGDVDPDALDVARENIAAGSQPVHLVQWDARQLPLADRSVNAVAANLPYGRRSGSHTENSTLYPALTAEIDRVLRRSGTAVLLTTEKRLLRQCIGERPSLQIVSERQIDANGLKPALFIVQKA